MSYTDKKITQAEINAHHVQGATDYLIGNPQQNKAVFDDLPEFIAGKFNDLIDEIAGQHGDEIKVAVDEWLAEHPEVTTTVQDNSLTTAKYVDGSVTPAKLDRAYSTPADLSEVNANLTTEINVLDARMDEFASLPEGSTTADAELLDIRVGADGKTYPSAGDAVREQAADLKSDINYVLVKSNNLFNPTLSQHGYWVDNSTGAIHSDDANYSVSDYIDVTGDTNYGYFKTLHIWYYDGTKAFTGHETTGESGKVTSTPSAAKYIIVGYKNTNEDSVTVTIGDSIPEPTPYKEPYINPSLLEGIDNSISEIEDVVYNTIALDDIEYIFGELTSTGGFITSQKGIRFKNPIFLHAGSTLSVNGNYRYNFAKYDYDEQTDTYTYITGTYGAPAIGTSYTIPSDGYFMMSIWKPDNTRFEDLSATSNIIVVSATNLLERMENAETDIKELQNPTRSIYDRRDVTYWGEVPSDYYSGLQSDYSGDGFKRNTTFDTLISKFDTLVDNVYVTRSDLGVSSDGTNHLFEYDFIPPESTLTNKAKKQPKVLIISGQHGFEKASVYGLYYFFKDITENWHNNPILEYMRHHVIFKIIPCANPYGFNNNAYWNANGVNLNRNYATKGWVLTGEPFSSTYGGATAGSEPETQMICSFIENNLDSFILMDFHTNGQTPVSNYTAINWLDFPPITDSFYDRFKYFACSHVENITAHFNKDYNLGLTNQLCGHVTSGESGYTAEWPSADVWALEHGVTGHTIEGFTGFPGGTSFSSEALKGNSELIGNWLKSVLYGCHLLV